ncbi:MAG: glycosyltransferase, partial [Actinobacteria bacterium]|nr:glycosyltransferase [Actinomycetota bacterium]
MERPTLSLCMIVKDEEKSLPRCLNSVRGVADEMIVVDTGSRDRTVEVARSFGAAVFHFPWNGSFSDARNFGIDRATGDWILILDADDELSPDDRGKIHPLLLTRDVDGYAFQTVNFTGPRAGGIAMTNLQVRLFRNRSDFRYVGAIHEQIFGSSGYRLVLVPEIRVLHYGYLNGPVEEKKKFRRNAAILKRVLKERPGDGFALYNLGSEYLRRGAYERALPLFLKAYGGLDPRAGFGPELTKKLALCRARLGYPQEAQAVLTEGLDRYPDFTDLAFLRGSIHMEQRQYSRAIRAFHQCLEMGDPPAHYASDGGCGGFRAWYSLGLAHEAIKNYSQAVAALTRSLELNPKILLPVYHIARILRDHDSRERMVEYLRDHLDLTSPHMPVLLADVFANIGEYELALGWLDEFLRQRQVTGDPASGPQAGRAAFYRGVCLLGLGRYGEAASEFTRALKRPGEDLPGTDQGILLNLCVCHWASGDPDKALSLIEEAMRWPRRRRDWMPYLWFTRLLRETSGAFQTGRVVSRDPGPEGPGIRPPVTRRGRKKYREMVLDLVGKLLELKCHRQAEVAALLLGDLATEASAELGKVYRQHELLDLAEGELLKAHQSGVTGAPEMESLGGIYLETGRYSEAAAFYIQALDSGSPGVESYEGLARTYLGQATRVLASEPKPVLTLCMIVRDEETSLPRCLESVRGVPDEIVVVDTGSKDRTPEIAVAFGAKVFSLPWPGDFSRARNFSLEKAQGEWILVLDADQEIHREDQRKIRGLLSADAPEGYFFKMLSYVGNSSDRELVTDLGFVLFRNRPGYRFRRPLHEQIIPSILERDPRVRLEVADVRVLHYGYLEENLARKNKNLRNREILLREIRSGFQDPFLHYALGAEYMHLERYDLALEEFEIARREAGTGKPAYYSDLLKKTALCQVQCGHHLEALNVLEEGLKAYPDFTDFLYLRGEVLRLTGAISGAARAF